MTTRSSSPWTWTRASELWTAKIGPIFTFKTNAWGDGPRSTPTVDGNLLYALGGQGELICVDRKNKGKEVWRKNLIKDLGGEMMSEWGYSESPLVDGDTADLHARAAARAPSPLSTRRRARSNGAPRNSSTRLPIPRSLPRRSTAFASTSSTATSTTTRAASSPASRPRTASCSGRCRFSKDTATPSARRPSSRTTWSMSTCRLRRRLPSVRHRQGHEGQGPVSRQDSEEGQEQPWRRVAGRRLRLRPHRKGDLVLPELQDRQDRLGRTQRPVLPERHRSPPPRASSTCSPTKAKWPWSTPTRPSSTEISKFTHPAAVELSQNTAPPASTARSGRTR